MEATSKHFLVGKPRHLTPGLHHFRSALTRHLHPKWMMLSLQASAQRGKDFPEWSNVQMALVTHSTFSGREASRIERDHR